MKLRVGVVGLGDNWESRHRPALRALSDRFVVVAVCADVFALAEKAGRELGAHPVDGVRALCARDDVDAVLVLSPKWYGPLPILAACDAGKAIYCAATLDIDPGQAQQIKHRVEQSGVAFMAELPRRSAPATVRLKELIATHLGKPRLLFCHERLRLGSAADRRHGRRCSTAMREFTELVDWCYYVVGEKPRSVVGVRHEGSDPAAGEDYQMMSLDFSSAGPVGSGVLAQISCGSYLPESWHEAITFRTPAALQVSCENGVAFLDLPSNLTWFDQAGRHQESLENERPVGERLLQQFHRAVTSLVRKTTDLEDAYLALSVVLAARTSCEEGRRVLLEL